MWVAVMILPEKNQKYLEDARVISQQELRADVFSLELEAPQIAREAVPGQFVQVRIPSDSFVLRRPLGVASADQAKNRITLIYREVGKGTVALTGAMPGETINVLGPLGHGFSSAFEHPLLVGGGLGLSPLLFYAESLHGKADVLMGGRTADELFWKELYADQAGEIFLTTDDGSLGTKGFVTTLLPELLEKKAYDGVSVCGPEIMMRNVAKIAAEYGIPCEVSLERRMGCGLGACLSCSIDTTDGKRKKVCKDGPVFPAQEVFA